VSDLDRPQDPPEPLGWDMGPAAVPPDTAQFALVSKGNIGTTVWIWNANSLKAIRRLPWLTGLKSDSVIALKFGTAGSLLAHVTLATTDLKKPEPSECLVGHSAGRWIARLGHEGVSWIMTESAISPDGCWVAAIGRSSQRSTLLLYDLSGCLTAPTSAPGR
jgi:hypothetical protein